MVPNRKDATLGELTKAIKGVRKDLRGNAKLSFAFVYPDRAGKARVRVVGSTFTHRPSPSDRDSLESLKFETGDYLDVAIM